MRSTPQHSTRRVPQPGAHPGLAADAFAPSPPDDPQPPVADVPPRTVRRARPALLWGALATSITLVPSVAAAHEHDSGSSERPTVTFVADNDGLTLPAEVPSGLVDVVVETEDTADLQVGGAPADVGHSVYIARLADGHTVDDVLAGGPEALMTLLSFVGGPGLVQDGATAEVTLDLSAGTYLALDNLFLPEPTGVGQFTVVDDGSSAESESALPESEGTVHIGPGMFIELPDGFDGSGVFEFVNDDSALPHEALLLKLPDGVGVPELVEWAHAGRSEPAPYEAELLGSGPLSPGQHQWLTMPDLEPGNYAFVCYVPFEDGLPHLSNGMVAPFTVA